MDLFEGIKSVNNIHPLFVHFPIALLLTGGILFFVCKFMDKEGLFFTAKLNFITGAVASVMTMVTGLIAEDAISHNDEIHQVMEIHEKIMITVVILSLILSVYILVKKNTPVYKNTVFLAGVVVLMGLLAVGADYGGKMVFKLGAGTDLFLVVNPELKNEKAHNHDAHKAESGHEDGHSSEHSEGEHEH